MHVHGGSGLPESSPPSRESLTERGGSRDTTPNRSRKDRVRRNQREQLKLKFFSMIDEYKRQELHPFDMQSAPARPPAGQSVLVCLRKRPLNEKETAQNLIDVVTPLSASDVVVHKCKVRRTLGESTSQ